MQILRIVIATALAFLPSLSAAQDNQIHVEITQTDGERLTYDMDQTVCFNLRPDASPINVDYVNITSGVCALFDASECNGRDVVFPAGVSEANGETFGSGRCHEEQGER